MNHTPEPWTIIHQYNIVGPNGRGVAACGGYHSTLSDVHDENIANAALISAAPELLTMLKRFYAATYGEETTGHLCPLDFDQAHAAIAKAEGVTNG